MMQIFSYSKHKITHNKDRLSSFRLISGNLGPLRQIQAPVRLFKHI